MVQGAVLRSGVTRVKKREELAAEWVGSAEATGTDRENCGDGLSEAFGRWAYPREKPPGAVGHTQALCRVRAVGAHRGQERGERARAVRSECGQKNVVREAGPSGAHRGRKAWKGSRAVRSECGQKNVEREAGSSGAERGRKAYGKEAWPSGRNAGRKTWRGKPDRQEHCGRKREGKAVDGDRGQSGQSRL